jgi:hypothetical protein
MSRSNYKQADFGDQHVYEPVSRFGMGIKLRIFRPWP